MRSNTSSLLQERELFLHNVKVAARRRAEHRATNEIEHGDKREP